MTAILRTRTPEPGSIAWIEQRRKAIFATDAAPAAGLSRFSDPHTLYMDKLALTAPKVQTEPMKWGKLLEGTIARQWGIENKVVVKPDRYTYWRTDLPFPMATHLDYRTPDGLLEVKNASVYASDDFGEKGTDEVPIDYRLQCTHEMIVTGTSLCHLVVLVGGNRLMPYRIPLDPDLADSLLTIEERAWQGVVTRTPPDIDGSDGASEYIRQAYPTDDGTAIELDETAQDLATAYLAAVAQQKIADGQRAELGNRLRALLGAAAAARGGGIAIAYRKSRDTETVDWRAVADELAMYAVGLGGSLEQRAEVVRANTAVREGNRPLLVRAVEA